MILELELLFTIMARSSDVRFGDDRLLTRHLDEGPVTGRMYRICVILHIDEQECYEVLNKPRNVVTPLANLGS
jgi:hypothetical protein